jgi:hypothetical protein
VFQRGNIHTHSTESDGDSPPEAVYAWYRDNGYNFLALTDHNRLTDPNYYRALQRPGFVIIPGEEITLKVGKAPIHVNAICHRRTIGGRKKFRTIADALRWSVQSTVEQGGSALINHPNFHWAFGSEALGDAEGARMLEIWSGHPNVHPEGDGDHPAVEDMWDAALTAGLDFAGVAVDDMHKLGAGRDMRKAGPGRGWIDVFAYNANEAEICDAIRRGGMIASSGVRVRRFTVWNDTMTVLTDEPDGTIEFIGNDGALLAQQRVSAGQPATYRLRGGEQYVRARVTGSSGGRAWTQAYRVNY